MLNAFKSLSLLPKTSFYDIFVDDYVLRSVFDPACYRKANFLVYDANDKFVLVNYVFLDGIPEKSNKLYKKAS